MLRLRVLTIFSIFVPIALAILLPIAVGSSSPLRRITNTSEEAINLNPAISGDGRYIAFESTTDLAGTGTVGIFQAIRADLGPEAPLFESIGNSRAVAPAISQDGSTVA